jgi:predicted lipoprotein with Yx(FWY)xxD motif
VNVKTWMIAMLAGFLALGTVAQAQTAMPAAVKIVKSGTNSFLAGDKGLTLYTYDDDTDGKSVCNGPCAAKWPPLVAAADAKPIGAYTIITRADGTMQWAYKGKPLYFYAADKAPMDVTGDGVNGKWHIVAASAG